MIRAPKRSFVQGVQKAVIIADGTVADSIASDDSAEVRFQQHGRTMSFDSTAASWKHIDRPALRPRPSQWSCHSPRWWCEKGQCRNLKTNLEWDGTCTERGAQKLLRTRSSKNWRGAK